MSDASVGKTETGVFARMREFVRSRDRSAPYAFAGRKRELALCDAAVDAAAGNNPEGLTTLVYGAPGMGKTALAREFMRRAQGGRRNGLKVLCAKVDPSALSAHPLTLVRALNEQLLIAHAESCGKLEAVRQGGIALADMALQLQFKRGAYELNDARHALTADSGLTECLNAYAAHLWPPNSLVAIVVDEMQDCAVDQRAKAAMRILHTRTHSARVALLCFGLPNTPQVLDNLGVSRTADQTDLLLGCLSPSEARTVVDGTFRALGMDWRNGEWQGLVRKAGGGEAKWDAWRHRLGAGIVRRSGNFPQHLTVGLQAACEHILESREAFLDAAALDAAARGHEAAKERHYARLLRDAELANRAFALGAVCRLMAHVPACSMTQSDATQVVRDGFAEDEPDAWAQAKAVLDAAIRKGVLVCGEAAGEVVLSPPNIPSLAQHLQELFAQALQKESRRALALVEKHPDAQPPKSSAAK